MNALRMLRKKEKIQTTQAKVAILGADQKARPNWEWSKTCSLGFVRRETRRGRVVKHLWRVEIRLLTALYFIVFYSIVNNNNYNKWQFL